MDKEKELRNELDQCVILYRHSNEAIYHYDLFCT